MVKFRPEIKNLTRGLLPIASRSVLESKSVGRYIILYNITMIFEIDLARGQISEALLYYYIIRLCGG